MSYVLDSPVYSYRYNIVNGRQTRQYYQDEPHQAGPFHPAEVLVEVEDEMVGQRKAHHQVGYGQVEHELVGDQRGEPPAERHGEDGERVAAHDEYHERTVYEAPRPVVVGAGRRRLPRLGRVLPPLAPIAECKVHDIAGRGRQRPLGAVRRRGRISREHSLTVTVARYSRFCRTHTNVLVPLTHFAHFLLHSIPH